jgi:hypothetical protein
MTRKSAKSAILEYAAVLTAGSTAQRLPGRNGLDIATSNLVLREAG